MRLTLFQSQFELATATPAHGEHHDETKKSKFLILIEGWYQPESQCAKSLSNFFRPKQVLDHVIKT